MSIRTITVLSFCFLAACVPHNTGAAVSGTPAAAFVAESEKNVPVDSYLLYLQARQNNDAKSAVKFLKQAIKGDPDNKNLRSEMFALLTVEGRVDDAFPYAVDELKSSPDSLLASLVVIAYHVSKGDFDAAQRQIDAFPAKADNAFLYPMLEVWTQAGLGNRRKALKALSELNKKGLEALYYFHAALLYDLWGDDDKVEENYGALLREPGGLSLRAAQVYGNWLLRRGETGKFRALLNAYRKGAKTYPLIDETFFTASAAVADKKVPKSVGSAKAGVAEAFFDISGSLADKGSPEISLFFIRFGLALDPSLSLARVLLGEVYEKQQRWDEALALYAEEKEGSEMYFAGQVRTAIIDAKRGDLEKAEKLLRSLAEKRPDLAFPWQELGGVFLTAHQYPQAAAAYTEAVNRIVVPDRSDWGLYYSRGVSYERGGRWDLAEQDLLQALVLSPDQPATLNYLGYAWIERGKNVEKAKEMLERAAILSPRDGAVVDSLGWMYYLLRDYQKSLTILEAALTLSPASGVINDHLGDAYWRVGRKREARYQWAKALSVDDDFTGGDRARVNEKLDKGLDVVGDKIVVKTAPKKVKSKKVKKSK